MTTSQKIIIVVLVLAILVLGFFIFKSQNSPIISKDSTSNNITSTNNTPPTPTVPAYIASLLAENPGSGATSAELTAFSSKVSSYAVDTSSVEVTACAPNPAVARVLLNKPINFKNQDSVAHTLVNGNISMNIPANSSKSVTPNFTGPGIYGYSCDTKITGIFLVMP